MGLLVKFAKSLVADGYKLVGWSAPILSIVFTLAKWQEWSVMETDLAEISYAWAFAPLTLWFFIAYVRRWAASQSFTDLNPEPDASAREIFHHMMVGAEWALGRDPNNEPNIYSVIDGALRDKAAAGRLKIWARTRPAMRGGYHETIEEVAPDRWADTHFDFPSCIYDNHETACVQEHVGPGQKILEDVQLNWRQVLRLWPRASRIARWRDPLYKARQEFHEKERRGYSGKR